jgi:hypothetical protein
MQISTWGIGVALALGVTTAHAAQRVEREAGDAVNDSATAIDVEPIGEVAEAASTRGTACRASCAVSYAALCLRVQQLCAGATVITVGSAAVPCVTAIATACLTSAAVAVICADRCPP